MINKRIKLYNTMGLSYYDLKQCICNRLFFFGILVFFCLQIYMLGKTLLFTMPPFYVKHYPITYFKGLYWYSYFAMIILSWYTLQQNKQEFQELLILSGKTPVKIIGEKVLSYLILTGFGLLTSLPFMLFYTISSIHCINCIPLLVIPAILLPLPTYLAILVISNQSNIYFHYLCTGILLVLTPFAHISLLFFYNDNFKWMLDTSMTIQDLIASPQRNFHILLLFTLICLLLFFIAKNKIAFNKDSVNTSVKWILAILFSLVIYLDASNFFLIEIGKYIHLLFLIIYGLTYSTRKRDSIISSSIHNISCLKKKNQEWFSNLPMANFRYYLLLGSIVMITAGFPYRQAIIAINYRAILMYPFFFCLTGTLIRKSNISYKYHIFYKLALLLLTLGLTELICFIHLPNLELFLISAGFLLQISEHYQIRLLSQKLSKILFQRVDTA